MGETRSYPEVVIPPWWEETVDSIAYDSCTWPPPIALVCGPGNSGKSTFCRVLLDTLLKRYKRVGYLNTDLGQPEFTVPGCLSLHIIDKRTPDLSILCLKTPERCLYFGDLTPKRDTKAYLDNIFSLYDYFCKEFYQSNDPNDGKPMLPLVVNTSGWVKGIGYDLLVEMLRYIAPTHVVQIRVAAENKNLPNGTFWLDGVQKESVYTFEICAAPKDSSNRTVLIQKDARMMRDIRITAYFRQCLPRNLNFSSYKEFAQSLDSIPSYKVPFSRVKIMHLHSQVSSSVTYDGLKDIIVGLAVSSCRPTSSECSMPWCIGLGIVRAVDMSKDLVYIVTPVSIYSLEKVDLLLLGYIEIPASLVQTSSNVPHKPELPKMDVQVDTTQKMFSEVLSI